MKKQSSLSLKSSIPVLVSFLLVGCFSGCALLGEVAIVEGALGRAALTRIAARKAVALEGVGLRMASGELAITNAARFRSAIEGIRLKRMAFSKPQLYLPSESRAFAEIVDSRTIRLLPYGYKVRLPGEMRTVSGNRVNVRTGPGQEYQAFRQVNNNQVVLVEAVEPGWYKVRIDDAIGWIAAAYLAALVLEEDKR